MRFVFFLGGLVGIAFTTLCFKRVPAYALDLTGHNDQERLIAAAFFCITLIGLAFTYFCVKEVFAPPRTK
jgi:hypothetical protein